MPDNLVGQMRSCRTHSSDLIAFLKRYFPQPLAQIIADYWRGSDFYKNKHLNVVLTLKDFLRPSFNGNTSIYEEMLHLARKYRASRVGIQIKCRDDNISFGDHRIFVVTNQGRAVYAFERTLSLRLGAGPQHTPPPRLPPFFRDRLEFCPLDWIWWVKPQRFYKEIHAGYRGGYAASRYTT